MSLLTVRQPAYLGYNGLKVCHLCIGYASALKEAWDIGVKHFKRLHTNQQTATMMLCQSACKLQLVKIKCKTAGPH